jgi:hypothetical protein
MAPKGALDQLGHALCRIIHAFAEANENAKKFHGQVGHQRWRLAYGL